MDNIFKDEDNSTIDFVESPTDIPPEIKITLAKIKKDEFLGMASATKEDKSRPGPSIEVQQSNTDQPAIIGQPIIETEAKPIIQPTMERSLKMPPEFESVRNRLLAEFPREHLVGINTERVENFIHQEGLKVKPFIIFNRSDLPRVKDISGNTGLLRSTFNNGESGLYSPEMDIVLVVRDEDIEKSSGTIYTEGVLAHELAHASSMYHDYVTPDHRESYTPRVGFCLPQNKSPWGWMLEEGWADMHRADYFANYASDEQKEKLEKALELGNLNMNDTIPITNTTLDGNKLLPLPTKYFFVKFDGKPDTVDSAYAGYALELLCYKDSSIKPFLIEARSSAEGLKKLAQFIDKIIPGLYTTLQTSSYTFESFFEKLDIVVSNIAGGSKNAIKAEGPLKNKWDELLNES